MFLITQAVTLMSGNKVNQVVDLTCKEPIEISDNEQGREAIDLTGDLHPREDKDTLKLWVIGVLDVIQPLWSDPEGHGLGELERLLNAFEATVRSGGDTKI